MQAEQQRQQQRRGAVSTQQNSSAALPEPWSRCCRPCVGSVEVLLRSEGLLLRAAGSQRQLIRGVGASLDATRQSSSVGLAASVGWTLGIMNCRYVAS
jgi:hypothetical protein